jgi:hypothetical protein
LGASALVIGLIEGTAEALVLVTKVFSGYLGDAIGRRKPLVLFGYGLAAAVKPLFPMATSIGMVTAARLLDRFGKGVRGAASVIAGWLWDAFGPATAFWFGAGVAALATLAVLSGRFGRRV